MTSFRDPFVQRLTLKGGCQNLLSSVWLVVTTKIALAAIATILAILVFKEIAISFLSL